MVGVASTAFQETVTQEWKRQIFTEPNRNQTMSRTTIEKDKSNMLSFVLNNPEHVIHFMFIIQVELLCVIFSFLFLLLCI